MRQLTRLEIAAFIWPVTSIDIACNEVLMLLVVLVILVVLVGIEVCISMGDN